MELVGRSVLSWLDSCFVTTAQAAEKKSFEYDGIDFYPSDGDILSFPGRSSLNVAGYLYEWQFVNHDVDTGIYYYRQVFQAPLEDAEYSGWYDAYEPNFRCIALYEEFFGPSDEYIYGSFTYSVRYSYVDKDGNDKLGFQRPGVVRLAFTSQEQYEKALSAVLGQSSDDSGNSGTGDSGNSGTGEGENSGTGENTGTDESESGSTSWLGSIGEWFSNLISKLGQWFSNLVEKLAELISNIGEWFSNLISKLGEWFSNVGEWILSIPQMIADLFKELLLFLFVPDDNAFLKFKDLITDKFPIIGQVKELSSILLGFSYGDSPIFTFTYNGIEFPLIDLTPFNQYKIIINSIIIAICYFIFIMHLIKRVPSLIRGL